MSNLFLMSGSQRAASYNTRLLHHLARQFPPDVVCDELKPSAMELPIFNEDIELQSRYVALAAQIYHQIVRAQGIVVASPEYNGLPTPYLKNVVDWVSRLPYQDRNLMHAFCDKPVLLCSASTGSSGGAVGLVHTRALFEYLGAHVFAETVCVPYADQVWSGQDYQFDPFFAADVYSIVEGFYRLIQVHPANRNGEALAA